MSQTVQTEKTATVFGIVTRSSESKVLMRSNGQAFSLPSFTMEGGFGQTGAAEVTPGFQKILSRDINILYRAGFSEDEVTSTTETIYVVEDRSHSRNGCCWFGINEIDQLTLARPEQKSIIRTTLEQTLNGRIPVQRPPWARHGWYEKATSWIKYNLQELGYLLSGPMMVVRNWCISYILRVPTDVGDIYFKAGADLPLFVNEASILADLGTLYPGHVPAVVATDLTNRWMLMKDFGDVVGWGAAIEKRKNFLSQFARLQQESAREVDTLLEMGCHDRRLGKLIDQFGKLANSPEVNAALKEDELKRLVTVGTRLSEVIGALNAYNLPETLVHGDLHGSNVAGEDSKLIFFDWSDASIAHPFFDMLDIFYEKDEELHIRLRDHYLSQWIEFEPMERLLEAWQIASILAAINQAISYQAIVANIEPAARHELDWGVAFWLRRALDLIEKEGDLYG